MKTRCSWVNMNNPVYIEYHDTEWGKPVYDDRTLYEFLVLEGAQAGLNWEIILKKRAGYRKVFNDFNYKKIANYDDVKVEELLNNSEIIRNKGKITSAIRNAKVFIEIREEFGSFSDYLWGWVEHKQIVNNPKTLEEVPALTELSEDISKDLKNRGMSFVGPTIIYSYLQAVGVVDNHVVQCFCKQ